MIIDVFGDGKHVFDDSELPNEIINEKGLFSRDKCIGISYSLVEPSAEYLSDLKNQENNRKLKAEESIKKSNIYILEQTVLELKKRIEDLEKK